MRPIFYKKLKIFSLIFLVCFSFCLFPCLTACKKTIDYFSYVSELRNNIFLAESDNFSLRIYSVQKESPYIADGIPQECAARTELYLLAPTNNEPYALYFQIGEKEYGGELSYDNVKSEYYLFLTLDVAEQNSLSCRLEYNTESLILEAKSVLCGEEIPPKGLLKTLQTENADLFSSMTDKYGFKGEIYFRLIYEGNPYYYVGIINRNGEITAFLINAKTGKILARRNS